MDREELDDFEDDPHQSGNGSKQIRMDDYIIVTDIVTDVTGYDINNEAFHNARKNDILPLLKALKLVEYLERKYYIRLGTKEYCIELLKELLLNDSYIELAKSLKKQTLTEDQKLELHKLKSEVSFRVYSPLPYFHGTKEGDFVKTKELINFGLLEKMTEMQGFKLYKSEVLYMEAMMKNINRYLEMLHIQSEKYIAHLHEQESQLLLSILTDYLHPELNSISVDLKKYVEKYPDNPVYKRVYAFLHEDLFENLQNIHSAPDTSSYMDDEYTEATSDPNQLPPDTYLHEDSKSTEKSSSIKEDPIDYDSDIDIIEI